MSSRARSRFVAAFFVAVIAAACTNPEPASGSRVLVVGDSLMVEAKRDVADALARDGWQADIEAVGGTTITDWVDRVPPFVLVDAPNVVVIELGTNDCASGSCPPLGPYIDAMMRAFDSADAVLWLNTEVERSAPGLAYKSQGESAYVNREIEEAAARSPNMFLVDLRSVFEGHPELHVKDGIHFNDPGKRRFAELIREGLAPFRPQ